MPDRTSTPLEAVLATQVVCAIIFDASGRILAAKRPHSKDLGSKWEFPGGKVEGSESDEQALVRELSEELCIEVDPGQALAEVTHTYPFGTICLKPYFVRILRGVPTPQEHDELRWLEPGMLGSVEWAPADLPIVENIRKRAQGGSIGNRI